MIRPDGVGAEMVTSLHQRHDDVEIHLDGDAYAWAWTPNVTGPDERLLMDLLPDLAVWCHLGRGRPVEPATWHDDGSLTVLVTVELGATGTAHITGEPISQEAVAGLAAAGLLTAIKAGKAAASGQTDGTNPTRNPRPSKPA